MSDSTPRTEGCEDCGGRGEIGKVGPNPTTRPCPTCSVGEQTDGDPEPMFPQSAQELARELFEESKRPPTKGAEKYDNGYSDALDSVAHRLLTLHDTLTANETPAEPKAEPITATPSIKIHRGPKPRPPSGSEGEECPDCRNGVRTTRKPAFTYTCQTCSGSGQVPVTRKDEVKRFDVSHEFNGSAVPSEHGFLVKFTDYEALAARVLQSCHSCSGTGKRPVEEKPGDDAALSGGDVADASTEGPWEIRDQDGEPPWSVECGTPRDGNLEVAAHGICRYSLAELIVDWLNDTDDPANEPETEAKPESINPNPPSVRPIVVSEEAGDDIAVREAVEKALDDIAADTLAMNQRAEKAAPMFRSGMRREAKGMSNAMNHVRAALSEREAGRWDAPENRNIGPLGPQCQNIDPPDEDYDYDWHAEVCPVCHGHNEHAKWCPPVIPVSEREAGQ